MFSFVFCGYVERLHTKSPITNFLRSEIRNRLNGELALVCPSCAHILRGECVSLSLSLGGGVFDILRLEYHRYCLQWCYVIFLNHDALTAMTTSENVFRPDTLYSSWQLQIDQDSEKVYALQYDDLWNCGITSHVHVLIHKLGSDRINIMPYDVYVIDTVCRLLALNHYEVLLLAPAEARLVPDSLMLRTGTGHLMIGLIISYTNHAHVQVPMFDCVCVCLCACVWEDSYATLCYRQILHPGCLQLAQQQL